MEHLKPGNWCVTATLIKDLSYKYERYLGDTTSDSKAEITDGARGEWCVAGLYDFLTIERSLALPSSMTTNGSPDRRRDYRRLILFPFEHLEPSAEFMSAIQHPNPDKSPFLVLLQITLSPVAFEFGRGLGSVLKAVRGALILLREATLQNAPMPEHAFFGSLSSPELVIIALPKSPAELYAVHKLARTARTLRLAEVEQEKSILHPLFDPQRAREWPGHACVLVRPTLAFLPRAETLFATQAFRDEETQLGLTLEFALRVDTGHESQVVSDLMRLCPDDLVLSPGKASTNSLQPGPPPAAWDSHAVRGRFSHMEGFAKAWKIWFDGQGTPSWRALNLVGSMTVLSFPDDVAGWTQTANNWVIRPEISHSLREIGTQLDQFAVQFLNHTQQAELRSIFNGFHSCFYRQDLLGMARDLYPFFRQLGMAMANVPRWKQYFELTSMGRLSSVEIGARFLNDLDSLFSHASRAVQNRIEHRAIVGDPPFAQTLREGACKIVSAYTVVLHLCWELFRTPVESAPSFASASHFAACVNAGTRGSVACEEGFGTFREHVENSYSVGTTSMPRLLSQLPADEWCSRLLLVDISGKLLDQPELLIAHCMHEAAELSDWILQERTGVIRKAFNRWVFAKTIGLVQFEIACAACGVEPTSANAGRKDVSKCMAVTQDFCTWFVPYCIAAQLNGPAGLTYQEVDRLTREKMRTEHPTTFVDLLIDAIYVVGGEPQALSRFAQAMGDTARLSRQYIRPPEADLARQVAASNGLLRRLTTLRELATEAIADTGMVCGLSSVLQDSSPEPESSRSERVARVFRSVFRLGRESGGIGTPFSRLKKHILHRWAVQAAASAGREGSWIDSIGSRLSEEYGNEEGTAATAEVRRLSSDTATFGEAGLVRSLSRFEPYGGSTRIPFERPGWLSRPGSIDRIVSAFSDAWRTPSTQNRLVLFLTLWAQSTRFAESKLLVRLDRDTTLD